MAVKIEASILSADFSRLGLQVAQLQETGLIHRLHVDVMDGHFVPNISVGLPVVETLRGATKLPMAVHLMITQPARYLAAFAEAGANLIWVHQEACPHLHRDLQTLRELGVAAGVALNPATPIGTLSEVLECLDSVLIMSVNPGYGGQKFLPAAVRRIRELRRLVDSEGLSVEIAVDGGVNEATAREVVAAGADVLVIGSALFRPGEAPGAVLPEVYERIRGAR